MATQVLNDTIFSTTEAAEYMGLAVPTVRQYIHRGLIQAESLGTINIVRKKECDRYLRERKPRGNPAFVEQKRNSRKS